ncbi:MAG TPA: hypothetical protein DCP69_10070 [Candidatus Omnitrophica bacterium]|nr:hypothetical protein [Candidatus Omnitrophota bacterium]
MLILWPVYLEDTERELIADVESALLRAGISHKAAALTMGVDLSLWTRQRAGDGHVSLRRLARLPEAFWREFIALRAEKYGITVLPESELTRALLLVVALASDKKMARMGQMSARKASVA